MVEFQVVVYQLGKCLEEGIHGGWWLVGGGLGKAVGCWLLAFGFCGLLADPPGWAKPVGSGLAEGIV